MIVCIKDLFVLPSDRHENQKLPQYLACKAFFFYFAYDISSFGIRLLELFLVQYFIRAVVMNLNPRVPHIKGLKTLRVPGNCFREISEKFTGAIT